MSKSFFGHIRKNHIRFRCSDRVLSSLSPVVDICVIFLIEFSFCQIWKVRTMYHENKIGSPPDTLENFLQFQYKIRDRIFFFFLRGGPPVKVVLHLSKVVCVRISKNVETKFTCHSPMYTITAYKWRLRLRLYFGDRWEGISKVGDTNHVGWTPKRKVKNIKEQESGSQGGGCLC